MLFTIVFARTARIRQIALVAGPGILGRAGQFVALTVFALHVSPVEYGYFAVIQAVVVGLASIVGSTAALTFNTRAASLAGAGSASSFAVFAGVARGHGLVLTASAVVGGILTPFGFALLSGSHAWEPVLALVGAASAFMSMVDAYVGVLAGLGRFSRASALDLFRGVASGVAILVFGSTWGAIGGGVGVVAGDLALSAVILIGVALHRRESARLPVVEKRSAGRVFGAGLIANVSGQISVWLLLWGIQVVAGVTGVAVYGVASRFASIVLLAPTFFGKNVIGQLMQTANEPGRHSWSPRSFVAVTALLSALGTAAALVVVDVFLPDLRRAYPTLDVVLPAVLVITSLRAVMIAVGMLCIARGLSRWWALSDVFALAAMAIGLGVVLVTKGDLLAVLVASGLSLAVSIAIRHEGLRRVEVVA